MKDVTWEGECFCAAVMRPAQRIPFFRWPGEAAHALVEQAELRNRWKRREERPAIRPDLRIPPCGFVPADPDFPDCVHSRQDRRKRDGV